jgi:RHS repeat-associated protein
LAACFPSNGDVRQRLGTAREFTGKERDAETGLDYFGARYMSAAQGRFTSPDPLLNSGHPANPQTWSRYSYALNNPFRFVDPDGAAVMDAGVVQLGTASFKVYQQQGQGFDRAALLSTIWAGQIGSNQTGINRDLEQFKQNQSSWWFPTQNNADGGCVLGCTSTFSEQGLGVTLNLSFSYDKNDNLAGANITAGIDRNARFIGPNPSSTVTMNAFMPGVGPPSQTMRVDINSSALKNLTPQQLQAVAKAAVNVPVGDIRNALSNAISREQKRRAGEQKKQRENCQSGQGDCPGN